MRTSIATSLVIPFAVVDDWPDGLEVLRRRGYDLVALTLDADAICLADYRFSERGRGTALMLGNEGDGLSSLALAITDARVRIPLEPAVDSLTWRRLRRLFFTVSTISAQSTGWSHRLIPKAAD